MLYNDEVIASLSWEVLTFFNRSQSVVLLLLLELQPNSVLAVFLSVPAYALFLAGLSGFKGASGFKNSLCGSH
jgi:hypothetical protein